MINTPFNYTGSKYKLLEQILPKLDYSKSNFVDLFVGGGSVYTNIIDKYENILINDIISDLVDIHKNLIFDKDNFITKVLNIIPSSTEVENYLELRDSYNIDKKPEKLYALMLSCTNNMIRFNKKFLFNQTFGKRSYNPNTELKINNFVNHIYNYKDKLTFSSISFENVELKPNTMYYIDPPYFNTEAGYNSYWSKNYEQDLYNYIISINNIGSSFMISGLIKNDGTDSEVLLKLLKDGFYYDELKCNYNKVSKVGDKNITEIIIYNYK